MNWINAHGGKNDLKTQLDFAIDEIQNKFGDYLNNLRNAQSVKDATAYTYLQYTGGQHTGIKDTDDLYRRVSKMEAAYAKKHQELYGKSGSGDLDRRVKYAEESIFAKLGAKLPKFQEGNKLGDPLDRPTALERIPAFVEMRGRLKGNQYDGPDMYDYRYGKYDPVTKHWSSRDPLSGMILKNPKHPTFKLEQNEAHKLGYKIYRDKRDGRLYERLPEEPLEPTFEETDY